MNRRGLICACLIGLACAISAPAQETKSGAAHSVIGFLDPQTGTFRPLMATTTSPDLPSMAVTGTLKIAGTIQIISLIAPTTLIECTATAVVAADPSGPITEEVTSMATRSGTDNTARCAMLIPYEWILQNLADSVSLSVSVSAGSRIHTRQLTTFKVPANGTTTSFTFGAHL